MKNKKSLLFTLLITLSIILSATYADAQKGRNFNAPNNNRGPENFLPDVTDAQKEKIQDFRTKHLKETTKLRNQLNEKRAKLQTLRTQDKTDMNAINNTCDEISELHNMLLKNREIHVQDIRKILTEEQRVIFDAHQSKRGHKSRMQKHKGNRQGYHNKGRGYGYRY